jgi:hypothetical protein
MCGRSSLQPHPGGGAPPEESVEPAFGHRQVRAIKPSQVQAWLASLDEKYGTSTAAGAYLVLHGCLDLAIADEMIKKNPANPRLSASRAPGSAER